MTPTPRSVSPGGQTLLDYLPPLYRETYEIRSTAHALGAEIDRIDAKLSEIRDNFYPQRGSAYLRFWEKTLGLAVDPPDKGLAQRRSAILARLAAMVASGSALDWQSAMTRLLVTGSWSHEEYLDAALRPTNSLTNPSFESNTTGWVASVTPSGTAVLARQAEVRRGSFVGENAATTVPSGGTVTLSSDVLAPILGRAEVAALADVKVHAAAGAVTTARVQIRAYSVSNAYLGSLAVPGGPVASPVTGTWYSVGGEVTVESILAAFPTATSVGIEVSLVAGATTGAYTLRTDAVALVVSPGFQTTPTTYFDGSMSGYEWTGTANASTSRKASAVPAYTVVISLSASAALAAPASLAATPSTTGGTLATGTYWYVITAVNGYGETTISNRVSAAVTGPTGSVGLTWAAVAGATGYNIYRGSASGLEKFMASVAAVTAYTDTGAATPDATRGLPTVNTTQSPAAYDAQILARDITPAHLAVTFSYQAQFKLGTSKLGDRL